MAEKQIRVLHIVPNMHAAGLETFIMNMYRNIDRDKVRFDFLTHYPQKFFYDDEIESLGGKVYRMTFREDMNLSKYLRDLNHFFREHRYDVVHSHMASTSLFTLYFAKKYRIPVRIVHSHNTSTDASLKGRLKSLLLKQSKMFANTYFACGIDAGRYLFGQREFTVINNAIEVQKFEKAEPMKGEMTDTLNLDGKYVLGHVGRFTLQKNHAFLLQLMAGYRKVNPDARMLLVGEGELEDQMREKVHEYELSDVVYFLGVQKDMPSIYKLFDVFLLPSLFEGLPVVGVECQAAGVETIFSDRITKEVGITDYAHYVSIDEGIDPWIKKLEEIRVSERPIISSEIEKIEKAGFEVKHQAAELLDVYRDELRKHRNNRE